MTYAPVDTQFPTNPKVIGLSDSAFRVYVEALCFAKEHLTDGEITEAAGRRMHPRGKRVCDELVQAQLWNETETGYQINGWLERNRSRAEVEEMRRVKAAVGSKGGRARAKRLADSKQTASKVLSKDSSKNVHRVQSTEGKRDPEVEPSGSTSAQRNEQWDALAAIFGYSPATRSEQKEWGQHVRDLKAMGFSGSSVHELARRYKLAMPKVEMTPRALVRNGQRLMSVSVASRGGGLSSKQLLELGAELERNGNGAGASRREGGVSELAARGGDSGGVGPSV